MAAVALVGTLDTKGPDFAFLAARLRAAGAEVIVVDAGTGEPDGLRPDIDGETVAAAAGTTRAALRAAADRGRAVTAMGRGAAAVVADLVARGRVGGVLAAGGSGGSSIAGAGHGRAAGRPAQAAGVHHGLRRRVTVRRGQGRLRHVLGGGRGRASTGSPGWCSATRPRPWPAWSRPRRRGRSGDAADADDRPLIAASMFGVTTPAVETARARLAELGYEVLVFHATGAGGRALEALAEARLVSGVLDLTTTELADDLVGGVLSAGPDRLTAAGAAGLPQVIAPGALDMVNFGPPDTVPGQFGGRLFFEHNPTVTLMRTTPEEMAELGSQDRPQGGRRDRAGRGVLARPRGQRARRRRPAVLRPGRRRGLPGGAGPRADRGRAGACAGSTRTSTTRRSPPRWPTGCTR